MSEHKYPKTVSKKFEAVHVRLTSEAYYVDMGAIDRTDYALCGIAIDKEESLGRITHNRRIEVNIQIFLRIMEAVKTLEIDNATVLHVEDKYMIGADKQVLLLKIKAGIFMASYGTFNQIDGIVLSEAELATAFKFYQENKSKFYEV